MKAKPLEAFAIGLLLLTACKVTGDEPGPTDTTIPTGAPTVEKSAFRYCGSDGGLTTVLTLNSNRFKSAEPIEMSLTVVNCRDDPMLRRYTSAQRYEFSVYDQAGNEIWRWSADKVFSQNIVEVVLDPGDTVTYFEVWDQRDANSTQVLPGRYEIRAHDVGCWDEGLSRCRESEPQSLEMEIAP